jgi:hypothetical protein
VHRLNTSEGQANAQPMRRWQRSTVQPGGAQASSTQSPRACRSPARQRVVPVAPRAVSLDAHGQLVGACRDTILPVPVTDVLASRIAHGCGRGGGSVALASFSRGEGTTSNRGEQEPALHGGSTQTQGS